MDKHQLSQLLTMQQQCDGKPEKNLPQKSAPSCIRPFDTLLHIIGSQ